MYDVLIYGGTLMDGTGKPGVSGDLGVKDGVICAMGRLKGENARLRINAEGLVVAPGFIDAHAHSDTSFLEDTSSASKLYQGVCTEISGNCGGSPFPCNGGKGEIERSPSFEAFVNAFRAGGHRMGVNQALLMGHGTLRRAVLGDADRVPSPGELQEMRCLLSRELASGAWGLSLGLEYAPGCFAAQQELNALGEVVSQYRGIVTCHMRSEGLKIDQAIDELCEIGRTSGAHVHISHLKLDNRRVHGQAAKVWERIEGQRSRGVNVTCDMYPYTASRTGLTIRCPKWSLDGGSRALLERLRGPRRQEIIEGIRAHYFDAASAETCLFCGDGGLWPEITGRTLRDVAETLLHTQDYAAAAAAVLERTRAQVPCIFFVMNEADMLYFLSRETCIGSDGYALPGEPKRLDEQPHPRSFGAIAEFFRLAREKQLCSVEQAVRRVTSLPAGIFGLSGRGLLREGAVADVTVFDPEKIAPRAAYLAPQRLAVGVQHVLIAGCPALRDGAQTEERAGEMLVKKGQ